MPSVARLKITTYCISFVHYPSIRNPEMWNGSKSHPASALTHCSLALKLRKKTTKIPQSLAVFDDDISSMRFDGYSAMVEEKEVSLKVNVTLHMMDTKAVNLCLGLGGAYCDWCNYSRYAWHDLAIVEQGFEITRTVNDLQALFEEIGKEDGSVAKWCKYYVRWKD